MGLSHKIQAGARKGNTKQARWKKRFKKSQTDQTWKKVAVNGKEIGEKRPM
jgi:hypothetical protein